MSAPRVRLREPHPGRELYPRYVPDAGIIAVTRRLSTSWPYGVDVDGRIVFDLDAERMLANFDVHSRRRLWRIARPYPRVPTPERRADLEFTEETVEVGSFHRPFDVATDESGSTVLVTFGDLKTHSVGISLSAAYVALLNGSELVGFALRL